MSNVWSIGLTAPFLGTFTCSSTRSAFLAGSGFLNRTEAAVNGLRRLQTAPSRCQQRTVAPSSRAVNHDSRLAERCQRQLSTFNRRLYPKSFVPPQRSIRGQSSPAPKPSPKPPSPRQSRSHYQIQLPSTARKQIFGADFPQETAEDILEQICQRRLDGSLAEEGFNGLETHGNVVTEEKLLKALDYSRERSPLDEEANHQAWVQRQVDEEQEQLLNRAQSLGLYKKDDSLGTIGTSKTSSDTAMSAVDRGSVLIQRRLELEAEKKEKEEKRKQALAKGGAEAEMAAEQEKKPMLLMPWQNTELSAERKERDAYYEQLRREAEIEPDKILANRSALSRLLAPTLFSVAATIALLIFAEYYIPPSQPARMWKDTAPSISTCWAIAVINAFVFIAWRRPGAWKFLNRNFVLAAGHPRVSAMVGNLFSHQQLGHFIINMTALMLIGPTVHEEIGRGNFLALFLISGLAGSLTNLYSNVLLRNFTTASLGASGCLYGLMAAFFTLRDDHSFRVPFTSIKLDYSSNTGLLFFLALEVLALFRFQGTSGLDHLSHLGGLAAGYVYSRYMRASAEKTQRSRDGGVSGQT